jgi:hypothetical protein
VSGRDTFQPFSFCLDLALLKKCVADRRRVSSLDVPRSVAVQLTPMHYAVAENNVAAAKILRDGQLRDQREARVAPPRCFLQTVGTGVYNYR